MNTRRQERLESALAEYDGVVKQAIAELRPRNDKDFFWADRVADFRTVAVALRRKHKRLIRG